MSDSDHELRLAQEQLYENEGLPRHLTDEQATPLLAWAAGRLRAAAGASLPQAQEQVSAVLRLIDQAAAQEDSAQRQDILTRFPPLVRDLRGDAPHPPVPPTLAPPAAPPAARSARQPSAARQRRKPPKREDGPE